MILRRVPGAAGLSLLFCAPAHARSGPTLSDLTGSWSQQSRGQNLVLKPIVKLQPYGGSAYGTNLGGSVGSGSATTTVVRPQPRPLQVKRSMSLTIAPDGGYVWTSTTERAEATCTVVTRRETRGRATVRNGEAVFQVA